MHSMYREHNVERTTYLILFCAGLIICDDNSLPSLVLLLPGVDSNTQSKPLAIRSHARINYLDHLNNAKYTQRSTRCCPPPPVSARPNNALRMMLCLNPCAHLERARGLLCPSGASHGRAHSRRRSKRDPGDLAGVTLAIILPWLFYATRFVCRFATQSMKKKCTNHIPSYRVHGLVLPSHSAHERRHVFEAAPTRVAEEGM